MEEYKREWTRNIKTELISGIVVCMALIPEAIGFTIVAGVDPMVGVYSCFCMSVIISIFGGRTGMISAAAGSMAFVLASLVRDYGVEYMLLATILTGVFQLIFGYLKIGNLLKFIPKPVMVGFVNALGIMMLKAQLPHFKGSFILIVLAIIGIAIIYLFPRITKKIPSPIVAIVVITAIVIIAKVNVETLGDMGKITQDLPKFAFPKVPLNLETLKIVLPYSLSLSIVGLVESLLTAQLVDEETDTKSNKNKECVGQGLANIVTGFCGGIAGCGMIGQTVVNMEYGGRGRLSTFTAGTSMLIFIIVFNKIFVRIPVVALAAVMVVVAITTFNWHSIRIIKKVPIQDTIVMISTVIVVLLTHNLAYGVILGIILSSIFFVAKISNVEVVKVRDDNKVEYFAKGSLFFASTTSFINKFDYHENIQEVNINISDMNVYDESAVDAIDKVISRFKKNGLKVKLIGVTEKNKPIIEKLSEHNKDI